MNAGDYNSSHFFARRVWAMLPPFFCLHTLFRFFARPDELSDGLVQCPSFPLFASRFTSEEDYHFEDSFYSFVYPTHPPFFCLPKRKEQRKGQPILMRTFPLSSILPAKIGDD